MFALALVIRGLFLLYIINKTYIIVVNNPHNIKIILLIINKLHKYYKYILVLPK